MFHRRDVWALRAAMAVCRTGALVLTFLLTKSSLRDIRSISDVDAEVPFNPATRGLGHLREPAHRAEHPAGQDQEHVRGMESIGRLIERTGKLHVRTRPFRRAWWRALRWSSQQASAVEACI